jgi:hypothetical protein
MRANFAVASRQSSGGAAVFLLFALCSLLFGLCSLVFALWSLVFALWSLVFGLWSLVFASALCFCGSSKSARCARKGSPYAVSERGTRRPAGELAWMPIPFRQGRSPVEKPGRLSRLGGRSPQSTEYGVPFLWVTFLDFGHPCPPPFGPASLFAHAPACAWARKEK